MPSIITATSAKVITVTGGTLFALAQKYLGDASQWNRIAKFNGLTDPFLSGVVTLRLPPVDKNAGNGGILYG
ncbi:hypothetical protein GCM10007036_14520 [Alsobacter metallidurans]|uniref:LysM domain-containing protein n=1 Tax=Alsobacter metallidurans TaxID=340221 RepID=A0A917I695_9HYPH|nr:hypothetical protein [Alsobacter metallidurans]GGH14903.1 hypothetical protein GCM10007036_14520 [Alsobacter metallidurans]